MAIPGWPNIPNGHSTKQTTLMTDHILHFIGSLLPVTWTTSTNQNMIILHAKEPELWLPCLPHRLKYSKRVKDWQILNETFKIRNGAHSPMTEISTAIKWSKLHSSECWTHSDNHTFHQSQYQMVDYWKLMRREAELGAQHKTLYDFSVHCGVHGDSSKDYLWTCGRLENSLLSAL